MLPVRLPASIALAAATLLAACASTPPLPVVAGSPPPLAIAADVDAYLERGATWGGMIVETRNYERHSEIEVLAFPLDRRLQPDPRAADLGRFVLLRAGFLDPQVYAPGRFLTATGRISGDRRGQLRTAPYVWPELDADALHLWPRDFRHPRTRFSVSIGIGVFR